MKVMRVLQVISSEGYYGAESMICTLGRALSKAGHQSMLAVFADLRAPHTEVAEAARNLGIAVHLVECSGRVDRNSVHVLRDLIRKTNTEIVHSHGYKADLYSLAAARREPTPPVRRPSR